MDWQKLYEVRNSLTASIRESNSKLLDKFPNEKYIRYLKSYPKISGYGYVSSSIELLCRNLTNENSQDVLELYHKLVLVNLMDYALDSSEFKSLPSDLKRLYEMNFKRILRDLESSQFAGFYNYSHDKFKKDLAVCNMRLIPAGAQKINVTRIPKKFLFRNGPRQFVRGLEYFLAELRGITLFEMHTDSYDPELLEDFTEEGWKVFYERVSELLELFPNVKGIFGMSWFFDPALKAISPHLAYLGKMVIDKGGRLFYNGMTEGSTKDALTKSQTRRRLYEEGKYLPCSYVAFLSRRRLIPGPTRGGQ